VLLMSSAEVFPWSRGSRKATVSFRDLPRMREWLGPENPAYRLCQDIQRSMDFSRKEFLESICVLERLWPYLVRWEEIVEASAGHGLFGILAAMLLPPPRRIVLADRRFPPAHFELLELAAARYPYVKLRLRRREVRLPGGNLELQGRFVVAIHACGELSDHVAALARAGETSFALLPCCLSRRLLEKRGLLGPEEAAGEHLERINDDRVREYREWGYEVRETHIPRAISPYHRLIVAIHPGDAFRVRAEGAFRPCPLPSCGA